MPEVSIFLCIYFESISVAIIRLITRKREPTRRRFQKLFTGSENSDISETWAKAKNRFIMIIATDTIIPSNTLPVTISKAKTPKRQSATGLKRLDVKDQ